MRGTHPRNDNYKEENVMIQKKRRLPVWAILIIILACIGVLVIAYNWYPGSWLFPVSPLNTPLADTVSATYTPMVLQVTETSNTGNPSVQLASIQAGKVYSSFMLTYDVSIWNPVANSYGANNLELINDTECILGEVEGRGAPETWTRSTSQESIGTYDFRVEQWTDTGTGNVVLITYNSDSNNLFIAIIPGSDAATCINAAREVIEYSAANAFGPIQ